MTDTIALPITPPLLSTTGYRVFFRTDAQSWRETLDYWFCDADVSLLRDYYQHDESDSLDAWSWTRYMFFPEAWPPDVLDQYVWTGGMQLALLP
jgi:hypothetical protein